MYAAANVDRSTLWHLDGVCPGIDVNDNDDYIDKAACCCICRLVTQSFSHGDDWTDVLFEARFVSPNPSRNERVTSAAAPQSLLGRRAPVIVRRDAQLSDYV